jgi:hypothetical protein
MRRSRCTCGQLEHLDYERAIVVNDAQLLALGLRTAPRPLPPAPLPVPVAPAPVERTWQIVLRETWTDLYEPLSELAMRPFA